MLNDVSQLGTMQSQGILREIDLKDIKNSKNLTPQALKAGKAVDGKTYGIPYSAQANALLIRSDWLKNLGLEAPKTWDEMEQVAKAFTENDPDGNGKSDTYGIAMNNTICTGGMNDMTGLFESFGVNPNGWIAGSDGKAASGLIQPQIKDGLALLSGTGTIAGSTLTQDRALRVAIERTGLAPAVAVEALTLTPARVLGLEKQFGYLKPGFAADTVLLDHEWEVTSVWGGGRRLS